MLRQGASPLEQPDHDDEQDDREQQVNETTAEGDYKAAEQPNEEKDDDDGFEGVARNTGLLCRETSWRPE